MSPLPPGRYVWRPELAPAGPVKVVVDLLAQTAYVWRGGVLIGAAAVSTGEPGRDTPAGTYKVLGKETFHRSNLYDDAPMPFMQRLTWDGLALHAGKNPGHPASHGCVRLPAGFAKKLFSATQVGAEVVITDTGLETDQMAQADDFLAGRGGSTELADAKASRAKDDGKLVVAGQ